MAVISDILANGSWFSLTKRVAWFWIMKDIVVEFFVGSHYLGILLKVWLSISVRASNIAPSSKGGRNVHDSILRPSTNQSSTMSMEHHSRSYFQFTCFAIHHPFSRCRRLMTFPEQTMRSGRQGWPLVKEADAFFISPVTRPVCLHTLAFRRPLSCRRAARNNNGRRGECVLRCDVLWYVAGTEGHLIWKHGRWNRTREWAVQAQMPTINGVF